MGQAAVILSFDSNFFSNVDFHCSAVNPPRLQILRIDRERMIDDVMSHGT